MKNIMKTMKDTTMFARFSVVIGVLALLLSAAPCGASFVLAGDTWDVSSNDYEYDFLTVYGTLNLKAGAVVSGVLVSPGGAVNMEPGALVLYGMYIDEGTTVNIWGGEVPFGIYIFNHPDPQPVVTVYGRDFRVDGGEWNADVFIPIGDGTELTWPYTETEYFFLVFFGPEEVPVEVRLARPELGEIAIDIKPGSDTNPINLKAKGLVPVAILTTGDIEPIDPTTVRFAGAAPVHYALQDVDGDGDQDMLFHFRTQDLELNEESTEATLTAELVAPSTSQATSQASGGGAVSGKDKVQIIGSKSKK